MVARGKDGEKVEVSVEWLLGQISERLDGVESRFEHSMDELKKSLTAKIDGLDKTVNERIAACATWRDQRYRLHLIIAVIALVLMLVLVGAVSRDQVWAFFTKNNPL